ncbi:unnamed protein product, partial [Timema podura]|nr:unnamed protein product [Timema podura]
ACKEESTNKTPPRSFVDVPGLNRYKVHVTAKTWEEARKVCIAEKAHLVVINSEAEAKAVLKIWQEYPFPKLNPLFIFLGFNDIKGEGKYVTVTVSEVNQSSGIYILKRKCSTASYYPFGLYAYSNVTEFVTRMSRSSCCDNTVLLVILENW